MPELRLLHLLPEELLQEILSRLGRETLTSFNLASKWCYEKAAPLIWREVDLVDCRTRYNASGEVDEHDDTPLIKILLILASKPSVAVHVQTLTHRCHLPPPSIFNDLPNAPFSSQTLSTDPRTIRLVQLAARNLANVTTLRIVFGHPNLNDALLRCLFDRHRLKVKPIRKLWLECARISSGCNLSIASHSYGLPLELDFHGLESVRFRRLPLRPGVSYSESNIFSFGDQVYARNTFFYTTMQDGTGGMYTTSTNSLRQEQGWHTPYFDEPADSSVATLLASAHTLDDQIYGVLSRMSSVLDELALWEFHVSSHPARSSMANRGHWLDPDNISVMGLVGDSSDRQRERLPSPLVALGLLQSATQTLTCLTLDWVFITPYSLDVFDTPEYRSRSTDLFVGLLNLRFPLLRSFQFRNAVVPETELPEGLYLLDRCQLQRLPSREDEHGNFGLDAHDTDTLGLSFLEAHPNLQCLAWPMDRFFSEHPLPYQLLSRVRSVSDHLGRMLLDLRVDAMYKSGGEPQTEDIFCSSLTHRTRRRRFIEEFASKMTKVKSIKIEGGVPRDERRETVRALHASPLNKIVMIGVSCPLGNTWGSGGQDVRELLDPDDLDGLEDVDKDAIWQHGPKPPVKADSNFRFEANYGWPTGPLMLNSIASLHAATVTELKFCGYKGAPVLLEPTPITTPMLSALRHFHNLRSLILSLWLSTIFERFSHDAEIIAYWTNARSPSSTALVLVTDEEPTGWAHELRTKYAPEAIAQRVTGLIGPLLSEKAKSVEGGIHVRASFCVGDYGGIFDIDLHIGKDASGSDVCLDFEGPREELETRRRKSKLRDRRWF